MCTVPNLFARDVNEESASEYSKIVRMGSVSRWLDCRTRAKAKSRRETTLVGETFYDAKKVFEKKEKIINCRKVEINSEQTPTANVVKVDCLLLRHVYYSMIMYVFF